MAAEGDVGRGAVDGRMRAVVGLAQAMAATHTPRATARAAAEGACLALDGSFAAVSVWERELGLLRVLVNAGELAADEEEFPEEETYPVHDFPEIVDFLHEQWAGGGDPSAWIETAEERPAASPGAPAAGTAIGGAPRAARERRAPGAGVGAPHNPRRAAALRRRGRGCCVIAPIVLHGRAWGELYVARGVGEPVFTEEDADFATVLAAVAAAGIVQTERLAEARQLAFTDPLTGLANRRAVDNRLDEALESHRRDGAVVSLVVCDLNGLKWVNDHHGHAAGDRLLERFGSVLSLCGAMLPHTLVARLGGDEFCLLAVGPPADEVARVAEEVCRRAAGLEPGEGVAVGVASTGDPLGRVTSARRLFRLADAAQYRAKATRSAVPVVAGRDGGTEDPVVRLADAPERPGTTERRRFRR